MVRSAEPVTNHALPWSKAMDRTHLPGGQQGRRFSRDLGPLSGDTGRQLRKALGDSVPGPSV